MTTKRYKASSSSVGLVTRTYCRSWPGAYYIATGSNWQAVVSGEMSDPTQCFAKIVEAVAEHSPTVNTEYSRVCRAESEVILTLPQIRKGFTLNGPKKFSIRVGVRVA